MRLIDADKLKDIIDDTWVLDRIDEQPTIDVEPTWKQVKEYCNKRCFVIMTGEAFDELKAQANRIGLEMIYGYLVKDLLMFALACRQHNITEVEIHDFVLNVQSAYDIVSKEFENIVKECVGRMTHETD